MKLENNAQKGISSPYHHTLLWISLFHGRCAVTYIIQSCIYRATSVCKLLHEVNCAIDAPKMNLTKRVDR